MLISRKLVDKFWGSLCLLSLVVNMFVLLRTNQVDFLGVLLLGDMHSAGVDVVL